MIDDGIIILVTKKNSSGQNDVTYSVFILTKYKLKTQLLFDKKNG